MATKIRLMRLGKIRAPYYRIVVADARTKRDGRVIETIGKYHPKQDPSLIEVDSDRARYWLSVGAQPTEPVAAILKITGDWQAHKGLPAPEHGIQYAAPKADRKAIFEAAAKETLEGGTAKKTLEPAKDAPAKKTAAKKTAAKKAAPAEAPAADAPAADASPADAPAEPEAAAETAPEAPAAEAPAAEAEAPADAPAAAAEPEAAAAEPATETSSEG
ncbi:MAG TPA: 30S ribosomal protein S16 [Mycobacteriales bacterium]|nr:30S ribosomal protein S16 [Mycobacteriales bacterium]